MSVVLAYIKDSVVYFGCDNRTNYGNDFESISFKEGYKLRHHKDYVMGFVGKPPLDIKAFALVKKFKTKELTKAYLIRNFYKEIMKINNELEVSDLLPRGSANLSSSFMIGQKDKLFLIDSNGVTRINNYAAMGSGYLFVLPYLYNMNEQNINKTMLEAMKTCASKHSKVGGPYHFINTKDLTLQTEE